MVSNELISPPRSEGIIMLSRSGGDIYASSILGMDIYARSNRAGDNYAHRQKCMDIYASLLKYGPLENAFGTGAFLSCVKGLASRLLLTNWPFWPFQ